MKLQEIARARELRARGPILKGDSCKNKVCQEFNKRLAT